MRKHAVASLKNGQYVEQVYALTNMEIKTTRTGNPYLAVELTDATGTINGVHFDTTEIPFGISIGDPVIVIGTVNKQYNNIQLSSIQRYNKEINLEDFLASASNIEEMKTKFLDMIDYVKDKHLAALLDNVFNKNKYVQEKFYRWPAAQKVHHTYLGGLLEHTLAVTTMSRRDARYYDADVDLTIAGAALHDIGKLDELDIGLTIEYTTEGNLYGHTVLGFDYARRRIKAIEDFPLTLEQQLLHIILSHHGTEEQGVSVKPMTLEAWLVYMNDLKDSHAKRYKTLIEQQRQLEQDISSKDHFLGTRVFAPRPEE